ncbi:MAG: rhodanese-like domain-containing protein [Euryarchaeota archaeon]
MNFFKKIFGGGPDLSELIDQGALIVDVRTPSEYKNGHCKSSKNIPLQGFQSKINGLKKQNKVIITCCASGMRSGNAAKMLNQAGVEAYNGGPWQKVDQARLKN